MSEIENNKNQTNQTKNDNENNEMESANNERASFNMSIFKILPNNNKKYYRLKIFLPLILVAAIIIIFIIVLVNDGDEITIIDDIEENIIDDDNTTTLSLSYKLNQVLNYENFETKTTQIKIDNESLKPQKLYYIGNYSLIIYDFNNETKVYNACAVLFNLTTQKGEKIEVLEKNNLTLDSPLMKVDFKNETREIINLEIPEFINSKLSIYIYEFIQKIIPDNSYIFHEKKKQYNIFKDKNNKTIIQKKLNSSTINQMEDSINENNLEIILNNGTITEVIQFKKYTFNSNFSDETLNETFSTRNDFIKELSQSFESNMTLKSNDIDETYINEIKHLLNNISFIKYSPKELTKIENEKRRLNSKKINNKLLSINQLRNLDTLIIDPYYQPIYLDFPLFKSNFVGAKFGLVTKIGFSPSIGLFTVELNS